MQQIALSSVGIIDLANDLITSVNNVYGSWTAAQIVADMPQTFYMDKTSTGDDRLCAARIDGQPLTVVATNNNTPYDPEIINFSILFPGGLSTHPIHRPK